MSKANVIKSKNVEMKTRSTETKVRTSETKQKTNTDSREKRSSSSQRCHHSNEHEAKKTLDDHRAKRKTETTVASQQHKTTSDQKEQNVHRTRHRTGHECPSKEAFTVIAPNAKKRNEIQRKAKAELSALEDFKLRRAMGYVSIAPSRVGGCLTLEEVRNKQQQDIQMSQKQKQVKGYVTKPSVLHK